MSVRLPLPFFSGSCREGAGSARKGERERESEWFQSVCVFAHPVARAKANSGEIQCASTAEVDGGKGELDSGDRTFGVRTLDDDDNDDASGF